MSLRQAPRAPWGSRKRRVAAVPPGGCLLAGSFREAASLRMAARRLGLRASVMRMRLRRFRVTLLP